MVKAVIFDVDGTLIDTVDLHAQSWLETFRAFGIQTSFADVRHQIGKGGDQLMPVFVPPDVLETKGQAMEEYRAKLFKDAYLPQARGFPEVRRLFEQLKTDGLAIAIGSSCKADELPLYTDLAGVTDLIDVAATSDDAERSKPSPDIFEAVAGKLAPIARSEMIVVGDTPYDALAAGRAGIRSVGVLCGGFPEAELRGAGCVDIFADPADLLRRYRSSPLQPTPARGAA